MISNPVAVCFLPTELEEQAYFSLAQETNIVSEIAVVKETKHGTYKIRWFSQKKEAPLCGHATLVTAHVIFNNRGYEGERI